MMIAATLTVAECLKQSGGLNGPTRRVLAGSPHTRHLRPLAVADATVGACATALRSGRATIGAEAEGDGGGDGASAIGVHSTSITGPLSEPLGERFEEATHHLLT